MNRKLTTFSFVSVFVFLNASLSNAGDSSGGGGGVVRDANNPWFVQNTKTVTYCIKKDPKNFHLDDETIDQKIQAAVAYWKEEFSNAIIPRKGSVGGVEIATQDFQRVSCDKSPDISFQMGVLAEAQKHGCDDPKRYIGLTIRTSYDTVNLKGKGFVYIAADSGPLKPSASELVDNPWSLNHGGLLYRVLVHEMGHVFGLQHTSAPPPASGKGMMNASYPEWILKKTTAEWFASNTDLPNYFAYRDRNNYWPHSLQCDDNGLNSVLTQFFGIPAGWQCYSQNYNQGVLKIHGAEKAHGSVGQSTEIGEIQLDGRETITTESAIDLYLPDEETVFPNIGNRIEGPKIKYVQRMGTFHSADGRVNRECAVTMPLNEVIPILSGVMEGHYFTDLDSGH